MGKKKKIATSWDLDSLVCETRSRWGNPGKLSDGKSNNNMSHGWVRDRGQKLSKEEIDSERRWGMPTTKSAPAGTLSGERTEERGPSFTSRYPEKVEYISRYYEKSGRARKLSKNLTAKSPCQGEKPSRGHTGKW